MTVPRRLFFYMPALLTECSLMLLWLAYPIYAVDRFGASPAATGLLGMVNGAGYAFVALAVGRLCHRIDRRLWMLGGAVCQVASGLLLAWAPTLEWFVVLVALQGATLGFFWAPYMSYFSEKVAPQRLSRALGMFNMSWCIGGMIGAFASGLLYERLAPAAPFLAQAAVMLATVLVVAAARFLGLSREINGSAQSGNAIPPGMEPHPRARLFIRKAWLALAATFFAFSGIIYLFPDLARAEPLTLSAEAISRLHGLRALTMLLAFALMGATAGWHYRSAPLHAVFGLIFFSLFGIAFIRHPLGLALPFAALGIATGMGYGLSAYYSMHLPQTRGANIGIHEFLLSMGSTLGPIFGGLVAQLSRRPDLPFIWSALPVALLWLAFFRIYHRGRHIRRQPPVE